MPELTNPLVKELCARGAMNQEQAVTLELEMQRSRSSLAVAARAMGVVDEATLLEFLSEKLHVEIYPLKGFTPATGALASFDAETVRKYKVVPLENDGRVLRVGVLDPFAQETIQELRFQTGLFVKPYLVAKYEYDEYVGEHYVAAAQATAAAPQKESLTEDGKPSVVQFVDLLLAQAVNSHASDVHLEPKKESVGVRLRIDGVLQEFPSPPKSMYGAIVARFKIMSGLDIAERRVPQDGRIQAKVSGKNVDVRVSVIPLVEGESIVLRILERDKGIVSLPAIGFGEQLLEKYMRFLKQTQGIVLVTGPTGSGKSTTLYASLSAIQSPEDNIITIEDPVEYHLPFAKQIQVNGAVGLDFAAGLRAILRHDPDIVMVGEIRDAETARIAIQAALTGHLVLSTLHTNDASSAVTRLVDMGIEPFLVASAIRGVIAQRLVRKLCPHCKKKVTISENVVRVKLGIAPLAEDVQREAYDAQGCRECVNTGYKGRIGIFEVLELDSTFDALIVGKSSAADLVSHARSCGFKELKDDGLEKVFDGMTTAGEVVRVLGV
jgi:type II secretory ATPase GspE/PulE/Tfp pilus assembly ATPase PilB-like protein